MKSPLGMIEIAALLMMAGTVLSSGPAHALDIYIAPDGHDSRSGRFAKAADRRTVKELLKIVGRRQRVCRAIQV